MTTAVVSTERTGGRRHRSPTGSGVRDGGYPLSMAILILVLVVLAIIALILYISRRTRV